MKEVRVEKKDESRVQVMFCPQNWGSKCNPEEGLVQPESKKVS